jgi:hypothetical protein
MDRDLARSTLRFKDTPDRTTLWRGIAAVILFVFAFGLAWGSLTREAWPLALGILPLLVLLEERRQLMRTAIGAGFMMPAALPIGWGLWQLGHPIMAGIVPLAAIALFVAGLLTLRLGLTCLALIALPIWPNNPLIYLAALELSREAFLAAALIITIIEWLPYRLWLRRGMAVLVAFTITFAALQMAPTPQRQSPHNGYLLGSYTPRITSITPYAEWRALSDWASIGTARGAQIVVLPESATYEAEGVPPWCRDLDLMPKHLYAGVLLEDGRAEMRYYTAETCPKGAPFAYAELPIPYLTDGAGGGQAGAEAGAQVSAAPYTPQPLPFEPFAFWDDLIIRATGLAPDPVTRPAIGPLSLADWVICFEAFSLTYWLGVDPTIDAPLIVVSNDSWTDPLPVPTMRRKFSIAMARMIGRDVLFAERGATTILGYYLEETGP